MSGLESGRGVVSTCGATDAAAIAVSTTEDATAGLIPAPGRAFSTEDLDAEREVEPPRPRLRLRPRETERLWLLRDVRPERDRDLEPLDDR